MKNLKEASSLIRTLLWRAGVSIVLLLFLLVNLGSVGYALTDDQKSLLNRGILYYDSEVVLSSCGGSGLRGSENAEIIWNFFIDKGFTPEQSAGFMGNFHVETGGSFDPKIVQGGGSSDEIVVNGKTGYGIAQWTSSGRQQGLKDFAQSRGEKSGTLEVQLPYVMKELNGAYASVLTKIKNSKTVESAWEIVSYDYESPAVPDNPARGEQAQVYFDMFSGGSSESACVGGRADKFSGNAQEAAKSLLSQKGVNIFDDRDLIEAVAGGKTSPLSGELVILLASLAQSHDFGISSLYRGPCKGSNHCTGNAADINPTIDGQTISYKGNSLKIQKFIDDAALLMDKGCENGVPNQVYVNNTKENGSKCEVFVDRGTGPHIHLAVSS